MAKGFSENNAITGIAFDWNHAGHFVWHAFIIVCEIAFMRPRYGCEASMFRTAWSEGEYGLSEV